MAEWVCSFHFAIKHQAFEMLRYVYVYISMCDHRVECVKLTCTTQIIKEHARTNKISKPKQ